MGEIGLFETLYSLRAMRRLKKDPVPDDLLHQVIEAGTQAPSGANTQPWQFIVVRDPETKRFIQERYYRSMLARFGGLLEFIDNPDIPAARNLKASMHLAEHFHEVPVLLVVCGQRDWPAQIPETERVGKAPPSFGSIYPCVQNILLACRALGLGASLTTAHTSFEEELADHLGVPEDYGTVVIVPIGYPLGNFGPISRAPVEQVTSYDHWGRGREDLVET